LIRFHTAPSSAFAILALAVALALPWSLTLVPNPAWAQGAAPRARIALVDRIVAVVNREVITESELRDRVGRVSQELTARRTPLPNREVLERQVLERMIMEQVQLQHAREQAVDVDDPQVDQALLRIAESNQITLPQMRQSIEKDGIPFAKFREEIRREIIISRLRDREVNNRVAVAESEVDLFLEEQKNSRDSNLEYSISHILVRVPEQASPEQIEQRRARADEALKRARSGANFAELAASYSDAPEALKGGELGWRAEDRLPDLFLDAVVKLKPGGVSDVLRSPAGFHLLRLNETRGAGAPFMVQQNRVRHILVRPNDLVSESEAQRKLVNLRERIVNGVDFGELAKLNSDDGSAPRGGDLGWIYPGDTVPEFEQAMKELKIGEVSQPVKTPFGFHLIQVLERRTEDMSSDRKRLEARRTLREKKSDEAYQEWLRQMRDRAYVEYRLDDR
jgi:peptidyl-prolyl cis-trans isomerase SurA